MTVNGQRMTATNRTSTSVQEYIRPSLEAKVTYGVNRIEVEVVAAVAAKFITKTVAEQLEMEKMAIFAHVLRD